jgi:hypothetical protein
VRKGQCPEGQCVKGSERKVSEQKVTEGKVSERKVSERKVSECKVSECKVSERKGSKSEFKKKSDKWELKAFLFNNFFQKSRLKNKSPGVSISGFTVTSNRPSNPFDFLTMNIF